MFGIRCRCQKRLELSSEMLRQNKLTAFGIDYLSNGRADVSSERVGLRKCIQINRSFQHHCSLLGRHSYRIYYGLAYLLFRHSLFFSFIGSLSLVCQPDYQQ